MKKSVKVSNWQGDVYAMLNDSSKFGGDPKREMWTKLKWTSMNNMLIYGSSWRWSI